MFSAIASVTPEVLLPLVASMVALAAGLASGITWIKRAPELAALKLEIQGHASLLAALEQRLAHSDKIIDGYREKLRICQDINAELGHRIRELETTSEHDHEHPIPE